VGHQHPGEQGGGGRGDCVVDAQTLFVQERQVGAGHFGIVIGIWINFFLILPDVRKLYGWQRRPGGHGWKSQRGRFAFRERAPDRNLSGKLAVAGIDPPAAVTFTPLSDFSTRAVVVYTGDIDRFMPGELPLEWKLPCERLPDDVYVHTPGQPVSLGQGCCFVHAHLGLAEVLAVNVLWLYVVMIPKGQGNFPVVQFR